MNLDDLLRDTLTDGRWALPVPSETLPAVRRKRAQRRARVAVVTVAGAGAAVVALVLSSGGAGGGAARLEVPASAGPTASSPTPIPGSTPAYYANDARAWFMTTAQLDAFLHDYVQPSPRPEDTVPSPQASGPLTDRLVTAMVAAGVPGAEQLQRDEADSGTRGSLTVHGTVDGGDLYVTRNQLLFPFNLQGQTTDAASPAPVPPVEDVAGTTDALAAFPTTDVSTGRNCVSVVSPAGVLTGWCGQQPLAVLKGWAVAAAQWEAAHPVP